MSTVLFIFWFVLACACAFLLGRADKTTDDFEDETITELVVLSALWPITLVFIWGTGSAKGNK